ncbi:NUDIX hydrolase [Rhodopseudomonas sp. P2A-2r]|uniref:NUDIX hydrolase n=1 Tax=unclassified Rhodopseudomonas TaxID=2638247 RepID=UPI0022347571|nr:NUDIX hydrolase [Rhodopseudomonas sp. P2A-2r]UZE47959.1 NUDIX hydrolase [Rhodopseudomonas sp. P2A-2r]
MTAPVIHRVGTLDLTRGDWSWPFAHDRRAEIDTHFALKQAEKPQMFNGRVLLGRNARFTPDCFSADCFETDFASFLAWRDWGFPDRDVFNGFGMGAVRSRDGAFVLGEMGAHTSNAGRIYFASGTPDLSDLKGKVVDIAGSVVREVEEEIGLTVADYRQGDHWDCVVTPFSVAMMRLLDVDMTGDALQARLQAELARQEMPELCAIHLVRGVDDFRSTMPAFVTAFLAAQWAAA